MFRPIPNTPSFDGRFRQYREQTDKLKVTLHRLQAAPVRGEGVQHLAGRTKSHRQAGGPRRVAPRRSPRRSLTNAISEVTRGASKKIYFAKGHGERSLTDPTEKGMKTYIDNLKSDGYQVDELLHYDNKQLTADAQAQVIAGPDHPALARRGLAGHRLGRAEERPTGGDDRSDAEFWPRALAAGELGNFRRQRRGARSGIAAA